MTKKMKTKRSEGDIEIKMKNTKMKTKRRGIERKTEIETGWFETVGDGQRHCPIFFM